MSWGAGELGSWGKKEIGRAVSPKHSRAPALPTGLRAFSATDHVLYGLAWLGFLAVFLTAAWLRPDPSGLGTHTELHLPPCGFYVLFHKPCPSCGMTTAFTLMVHGHPWKALKTQPAGAAVFVIALFLWLYLPFAWRRRKPFEHILEHAAFLPVVIGLIVLILGVWGWRLLL